MEGVVGWRREPQVTSLQPSAATKESAGAMLILGDPMFSSRRYLRRHPRAGSAWCPAELPTQFGLVVNRKVAMHLGVIVPPALLVQARRIVD